jgi:multidrug resistance efflux pump
MISTLGKRQRLDLVRNDIRNSGFAWGRYVYIGLCLLFLAALFDYVAGSSIFLRADGLVLQEHHTIAPAYDAQISEVYVQPGQRISSGTKIAKMESLSLTQALAELATKQAEISSMWAEASSKLAMTDTMLPLARRQSAELQTTLGAVQKMRDRQLGNARRIEEATTVAYTARERAAELEAQQKALQMKVAITDEARRDAQDAYNQLKSVFNGGLVVSPAAGVVGPSVAAPGEVLNTTTSILEVFTGKSYILAYLPDNYLFAVEPGQLVWAATGRFGSIATIDEVLPVADVLPVEFQNTMRPRDRSQLVRIKLPDVHAFTTRQKVRISPCYFDGCKSLAAVVEPHVERNFRFVLQLVGRLTTDAIAVAVSHARSGPDTNR